MPDTGACLKIRAAGAVTRRGWARRERGPDHEGGVRARMLGAGLSWRRGMGPSHTELVHTDRHTARSRGTPPSLITREASAEGAPSAPLPTFRSPHLQLGREAPRPCSLNLGLRGTGSTDWRGGHRTPLSPRSPPSSGTSRYSGPSPYVSRDFSQPVCLFSQLQQLQQLLLPPFHDSEKMGWARRLATCAPKAARQPWPGGRLLASYPGSRHGSGLWARLSDQGKAPC